MPSQPSSLLVRIISGNWPCGLCGRRGRILFDLMVVTDGDLQTTGAAYCSTCAAEHGHATAVGKSIDASEALQLSFDLKSVPLEDRAAVQAEAAHLRQLLAAGLLEAPPAIPARLVA